ncbi:MAG TPA: NAD(P)H-hydrate epimerase, partial [Actinomycetota bacterium]|nr:NAD(P)H-hydrate epimerase [Actinomycetota bacterium]
MRPVLTAEEARSLEREAERRGTSVELLMERAGRALAHAAARLADGSYGKRAVIVAGRGNNGGDGLVAARHLSRAGRGVTVLLVGDPDGMPEPAATNLRRVRDSGVRLMPFAPDAAARAFEAADVAVDALLGLGLRGAPRGPSASAIASFDGHDLPVVAADIASGVEADTG